MKMKSRRKQRGGIWTRARRDVLAHRFTNCNNLPKTTPQERYRRARCLVDNKRDEWNIHYYHPYRIYDDVKIQTIKDQLSSADQDDLNYLIGHLKTRNSFKKYQKSRKNKLKGASIKGNPPVNTLLTPVNTEGHYTLRSTGEMMKTDPKQTVYLAEPYSSE